MMNAYVLVEIGKKIQGSPSDRAFALKNGLSKQNIVDWKSGKSLPSWENMEKLANAANLELWEAVKILKENEKPLKQAGFAHIYLLGGISAVSLALATGKPEIALLAGFVGYNCVYYVKSYYYVRSRFKRIWAAYIAYRSAAFWLRKLDNMRQ